MQVIFFRYRIFTTQSQFEEASEEDVFPTEVKVSSGPNVKDPKAA